MKYTPAQEAKERVIHWQKYSDVALVVSRESKKPVLLYFTLDGCPACELMNTETLRDPKVVYYINNNFVPIKIDASNSDLLDKYGVTSFPTIVMLSSKNNAPFHRLSGAINSRQLAMYLQASKKLNDLFSEELSVEDILKSLGLNPQD